MRKACPWQQTGGVVDYQMVDVLVRDAGLGKAVGPATRKVRGDVFLSSPRKAGVQGFRRNFWPWIPAFAGMTGGADHRRLDGSRRCRGGGAAPCSLLGASFCGKSAGTLGGDRINAPPPTGDPTDVSPVIHSPHDLRGSPTDG